MSTNTRKTKAMLEEELAEMTRQINEAKRQTTHIPVSIEERVASVADDDGGSHAIDHGTLFDNHEMPDTNKELSEDIDERNASDLSFWNNSWAWAKSNNSYGNNPEDSWFINPTAKLIGEVMHNAPLIYDACEVALVAGDHTDQLQLERMRHKEFLELADGNDLISEALDMLTAYQSRFLEAVQRYIGIAASYSNQLENKNISSEQIEEAKLRKEAAGAQCRAWAARLVALVEAYHSVVTDERAYKLSYNFAPLPPSDNRPPSKEYGLFKWSVTTTLGKVGRRLARSIKDGKMDAEKYRIPRPWLTEAQKGKQLNANDMLSDFNA